MCFMKWLDNRSMNHVGPLDKADEFIYFFKINRVFCCRFGFKTCKKDVNMNNHNNDLNFILSKKSHY